MPYLYENVGKMTKKIKKADLPTKICVICNRPFTWRKKWEKVWADVKYCSDRCRNDAKKQNNKITSKIIV